MGWDTRLAWSGEQPAGDAILHQRFEALSGSGATRTLRDAADPARTWTLRNASAATAALSPGRMGQNLSLNRNAPTTEQTSLVAPHAPGMWPSTGRILLQMWASLSLAQTYTPLISTRSTPGKAPLVYLSTMNDGRPRAQIYSAAGTLLLDQSETLPWPAQTYDWRCYLWLVDLDAKTSQLAIIRRANAATWLGPVRTFTGEANPACEADFVVATLSPTAAYWTGGYIDEVVYRHPAGDFSLADHVERLRNSLWARGADSGDGAGLVVADDAVTASQAATLQTGAEAVAWAARPAVTLTEAIGGAPQALTSTDDGASWSSPTSPDQLPAQFDGLLRWTIPLAQGERFTGLALTTQQPVPVVDPVAPLTLTQHAAAAITLTGTWTGTPIVQAAASHGIVTTVDDTTIHIHTGLALGDFAITVTLTDDTGQTSAPLGIHLTVEALPWAPPDNPAFARAPLIIYSADKQPDTIVTDPTAARLLREINGEEALTFSLPVAHPKAAAIAAERIVEAAGHQYRIRRITTTRDGNVPTITAYCEAGWYDLRVAGHRPAREFSGAQAGDALAYILDGTDWTVGAVTVGTRRTWRLEKDTALACLRAATEVHGGDLLFDSNAKTVSLVTFAGRDRGVAFFRGRGLSSATRVEDTTTLITRIEPRNAEGVGIEAVNGGVAYLEDRSYIDEVRHGVYQFASGTSPLTMMAMTQASLAKRARPSVSYEATVADLSAWSGQEADRFDVGDRVLIVDGELGISTIQRIVALEYDLLQPWASKVTLSEKLRSLGDASRAVEAGVLTTGADIDTKDLVPWNLLQNARFDNGLAHWASSGAQVVTGGATGARAVRLGPGTRWIEQTVATDTRDSYALSLQVDQQGGPQGWVPDIDVIAEITYTDGSTEAITLDLA